MHAFDGESVMLSKIDKFCDLKIKFSENHRGRMPHKCKNGPKMGFRRNPANLHTWSPVTMGHFFWFFFYIFSWCFCTFFWHDFPTKNLMRSHTKQEAKFMNFWESRRLCCVGVPICCHKPKLYQTMSKWPKIWGESSWARNKTNQRLLFGFEVINTLVTSRLDFVREEDVASLFAVKWCLIDLKHDREPHWIILRWSINFDFEIMVPRVPSPGDLV